MIKKVCIATMCAIMGLKIVYADNNIYKTYYLADTHKEELLYNEYILVLDVALEQKIKLILDNYFYDALNNTRYIPNGSKVLDIHIDKQDLYINFNDKFLGYGGGNYYEINLIRQILHTVFQFDSIKSVTFLVDGELVPLLEGRLIYKYTKDDLKILDDNQNVHLK